MTKNIVPAALLAALCAPAFAAGVAVTVGQPGFYGQIDIGGAPAPELVYPQPIVVQRGPEYATAAPVYLHVRPGYEKNWDKHCSEYNACGRPGLLREGRLVQQAVRAPLPARARRPSRVSANSLHASAVH